jgi:hypothetical protein
MAYGCMVVKLLFLVLKTCSYNVLSQDSCIFFLSKKIFSNLFIYTVIEINLFLNNVKDIMHHSY